MYLGVDFHSVEFSMPQRLWLLAGPVMLLMLWIRQLARHRGDLQRLRRGRTLPVRERFAAIGALAFWLCLIGADALVTVALAGPRGVRSATRTAGIDLIVLEDGSASMHVADVDGDRWQRSSRFLRVLAETISWKRDRLAMAVFASIATPQVRLTRDPNTFFFFLDHLSRQSPFRLEDDRTWDTNIESGLYWGLKLVERDEQLHGQSPNAKAFVLLSDGQAWSGEVARSLALTNARNIPVMAIGVGTTSGGLIPEPRSTSSGQQSAPSIRSSLDRASLETIAARSGGQYFELDRANDQTIAGALIERVRRRATSGGIERDLEDLHWPLLAAAAALFCLGVVFLQEGVELGLLAAGAAVVLFIVVR